MLGAVELYQSGYADHIVMVRNMVRGYDLVVSQGVKIPHDTDIAKEVAAQLGVPEEKITVLPGDALSTQDEAIQVREGSWRCLTPTYQLIEYSNKFDAVRKRPLDL
jgi:asparagine synthetase B (glutamine-hydrolysing)